MTGNVLIHWNAAKTDDWTLKYTCDNIENLNFNRSSGIMSYGLPIVEEQNTDGTWISKEKVDNIRISGVESTVSFSFDADIADIQTIVDLVENQINGQHRITIESWGKVLPGLFSSISISQSGGAGVVTVRCEFIYGVNIMN